MAPLTDGQTEAPSEAAELPLPSRKPYVAPAITHELKLETRAGSPLGLANPLNPFDPRPKL